MKYGEFLKNHEKRKFVSKVKGSLRVQQIIS